MTDSKKDDPLIQRVVEALEAESSNLDRATQDALAQARRRALDQNREKTDRTRRTIYWMPAAGLVSAVFVAMLWFEQPVETAHPELVDFELLTSEDELEMLEDMEFVAWLMLEEEQNAG